MHPDERESLFTTVIPVFNKWELTRACLVSLKERSSLPFDVVVADNGSSDETVAGLEPLGRELFGERFQRIRFDENNNFARGCNAGATASKTPLLFFLNNDTLMTPGWDVPLRRARAGSILWISP